MYAYDDMKKIRTVDCAPGGMLLRFRLLTGAQLKKLQRLETSVVSVTLAAIHILFSLRKHSLRKRGPKMYENGPQNSL